MDQSLRGALDLLRVSGDLLELPFPVPLAVVPGLLARTDGGPALRCEVSGFGASVVGNICNGQVRVASFLGVRPEALSRSIVSAIEHPARPKFVESPACAERVLPTDLQRLPIPRYFAKESAPYLTAGVVVAKHPDTGAANLSFARVKVLGPDKGMLGVSPNHHLGRLAALAAERDAELPVAICVGNHPAVMVAACLYLGFGDDELECAGALLGEPVRVGRTEHAGLAVPAESEMLLECVVSTRRIKEGPVSEYHGYYCDYGAGLELKVLRVTGRSDSMLQVILPGLFREHVLLGGISIAAGLEYALRQMAPNLVAVAVPEASSGRTAAVISVAAPRPGQPLQLIMAALAAVPLIKFVTVVDEDIDPWNAEQVEWARLTRSKPERDLVVIGASRSDRSEPLARGGVVGKAGVDATCRAADRTLGFEKAVLGHEELAAASEILSKVALPGIVGPTTLGQVVCGLR